MKIGDNVLCASLEYGRGEVVAIYENYSHKKQGSKWIKDKLTSTFLEVKFENRKYPTMCSMDKMVTIHNEERNKIQKCSTIESMV